ncbi:MAG: phosphopantothenoylcysteine decarboxylase [Kiritimatiellales bacterium]|nr:phosphopantothenoylcysteine decarboxylase [Kiritimatiellales bacterium]
MNKQILILSGPTHEYIDPVRFIGNASSGLMGRALAEEAIRRGYTVDFVTGPVADQNLPDLGEQGRIHHVTSAAEMLAAAGDLFSAADIAIFTAAVADYAPAEKQSEKMAKSDADLVLRLRPTPDIAGTLCRGKQDHQTAIGFALQTSDGEAAARHKLESKKLDGIVLNTPASLGAADGTFSFLHKGTASFEIWGRIDKHECARRIFGAL